MATSPKMFNHITPSAQEMIKAKGLATILDRVLQEIQTLQSPEPRIQKIEVDWEVDPEVKGWEMLAITLWSEGSPDDAHNLWRDLDKVMVALRQKVSKAELHKLNRLVSVGVDIE